MSSEIEVPETPNWLQELEAKRERRLKARLAHETGAGAPCLKCADKCPGLDLHFWRKCCKICKCSKEEHEVQDDDIYGWAQFQLLGSKPNKIKRKIVLPGKKDEVELDWAPTGHKETVDKYLKTLPPDQLPVKGSQAAQDRKQLLQKQIPIHDIDPTLCHELTEDELKKMNDYVSHVKQASVGVGQIVSLSSIIKGNLHKLSPNEAAIIASRYAKGVPLSEIVKLQSQNRAGSLKPQKVAQSLEKLSINDPQHKSLPSYVPNSLNTTEHSLNPLVGNKIHDVNYPGYTRDVNQSLPNAQFSSGLKPGQYKGYGPGQNQSGFDPTIDEKYLQNTNFDPKSTPSHFISQNVGKGQPNTPYNENLASYKPGDGPGSVNSAFVPYSKVSSGHRPGDNYVEEIRPAGANYASSLPGHGRNISPGLKRGDAAGQNVPYTNVPGGQRPEHTYMEENNPQHPNYARNLTKGATNQNVPGYRPGYPVSPQTPKTNTGNNELYENVEEMRKRNAQGLPNYAPGKYNVHSETLSPTRIPKNVKDLAFSTYDQDNVNPNELDQLQQNLPQNISGQPGFPYGQYPAGSRPNPSATIGAYDQDSINPNELDPKLQQNLPRNISGQPGFPYPAGHRPNPSATIGTYDEDSINPNELNKLQQNLPRNISGQPGFPYDPYPPGYRPNPSTITGTYDQDSSNPNELDPRLQQNLPRNVSGQPGFPHDQYPAGYRPNPSATIGNKASDNNLVGKPNDYNASGFRPVQPGGAQMPYNKSPVRAGTGQRDTYPVGSKPVLGERGVSPYDKNIPYGAVGQGNDPAAFNRFGPEGDRYLSDRPPNVNYENYPTELGSGGPGGIGSNIIGHENLPYGNKPNKKLSELHPGRINVDEDFLQPSQVTIGAIQDINYPEIKAATHGTNDFYEDYSPDSLKEILNNIILPDCHYCKKPFEENEFAITIDRANVLFHAACFKCAGCNQILADNVYFYNKETDNIYCGRDYAKIRGFPRCQGCDELIFTKEYCLAENSTFHLKHFCCIECDKPLAGQDYTLEDENPYCLPCFEQSKASKCSSCCRVIKPDEIGCNLNGIHFHANDECFACKMCKKPLMGKKLLLRNEKLYCSHDCFGADK